MTHSGSAAGSLFLRLGCIGKRGNHRFGVVLAMAASPSLVFGVTGVVYYSFLVFLCSSDPSCSRFSTTLDMCAIVFIFTQMHFIFCNSKVSFACDVALVRVSNINEHFQLSITGHHTVARFGTMHLIAANLWTWIRYVLMEEGVMEKEIQ